MTALVRGIWWILCLPCKLRGNLTPGQPAKQIKSVKNRFNCNIHCTPVTRVYLKNAKQIYVFKRQCICKPQPPVNDKTDIRTNPTGLEN